MKSETISLQNLFQDRRQYRVPFYQRAYVWNREDQWERLWDDIRDKAEVRVTAGKTTAHFLGAVVLEPQPRAGLLGVETLHIIDGQQRITTLQYVLSALAIVVRTDDDAALLSVVEGCLINSNAATMEKPEVELFKVWPTFRDREQFRSAMTASSEEDLRERFPNNFTQAQTLRRMGIDHPPALEAIWYFVDQMKTWLAEPSDTPRSARRIALAEALLRDLQIVSISLGEDDDAQVIFETLNGHGAQLHATDLIRNYVFMRADREGSSGAVLFDTKWSALEEPFWIEEQRRGRLKRPRLEWFFQSALEALIGEEVDIARLYSAYRSFATSHAGGSVDKQLTILTLYADLYRQLISGAGSDPIATFGREADVWDASTSHPLALLIATSNCGVEDQGKIFADIISYFVRRAVCGLTTKGYNKIFGQQLRKAFEQGVSHAAIRSALAEPQGDVSRWPRDQEFHRGWMEGRAYPGRLDPRRTRWILAQLERGLRSKRTEEPVPIALDQLDVDHVLPSSWYEHWPIGLNDLVNADEAQQLANVGIDEKLLPPRSAAIRRREHLKTTLGNLTLLHYGVNRGLQNRAMSEKGPALFASSNLHLNRSLMTRTTWSESDIEERGRILFEVATRLWKGPE